VISLQLLVTACATGSRQGTIWPPEDFAIMVEEVAVDGGDMRTERRFRVGADGLVVFATAERVVVDEVSGTSLPVFSRLSVYELVPTCTRALARRVYRAGVLDLDTEQGQRDGEVEVGVLLRWQAFDRLQIVSSRGRVHGAMAEVLAILAAHFPAGERFRTPGVAERGLEPVLRGVPEPREDAAAALQVYLDLLDARWSDDRPLLLDAFALACSLGLRSRAEELLGRWQGIEVGAYDGEDLTVEILARMLPVAGA